MFDHLIGKYRVFFEGLPDPVFYGHFYPRGIEDGPYKDALWSENHYGRGLKQEKATDEENWLRLNRSYENDLRELLNSVYCDTKGLRRGVVAIPSSKKGVSNRVTELVRRVLAANPGVFEDLTPYVTRARDKSTAHTGGSRSYEEGFNTIGVDARARLDDLSVILVIDDILTTGTSFRAMDDKLRASGFAGTIVNFAFLRTLPADGAVWCWEWERVSSGMRQNHTSLAFRNKNKAIEGLIFDFDQTLMDDGLRDTRFEKWIWRRERGRWEDDFPYALYDGVEELMRLRIPYAIVSNRSLSQLETLFGFRIICDSLIVPPNAGGHETASYVLNACAPSYISSEDYEMYDMDGFDSSNGFVPCNVFSFPQETRNGIPNSYYKPSPMGVNQAIHYLREDFFEQDENARIVGIGNTFEDIVAYSAAGIESVLALWGIPEYLREHARLQWGADYSFENVDEFTEWLKANTRYYEMALEKEKGADYERACRYYALATILGDNTKGAWSGLARVLNKTTFHRRMYIGVDRVYKDAIAAGDERYATYRLANLIKDEDPARARGLYERAIAAGDEYGATFDLAILIEDEDPARARGLYERAIAAGDERYATKNLALLIEDEDPERAKGLYERAIAAGDERYATYRLALLIAGEDPERARGLYERAIAAGDECYATNNLANLIKLEDPERARGLYERAIAAGDERHATYNLALLIADEDPERAKGLYERAIAAGDERFATCNLAHLYVTSNTDMAKSLYERSAAFGETEAFLGLAFLLKSTDNRCSDEFLSKVRSAEDKEDSIRFFLKMLAVSSDRAAMDATQFLRSKGFGV